jgi:hypothetical protein
MKGRTRWRLVGWSEKTRGIACSFWISSAGAELISLASSPPRLPNLKLFDYLTGRLLFDGKAKKEIGRSEMKGRTRWRLVGWSPAIESERRQNYGVLHLGRFLHS